MTTTSTSDRLLGQKPAPEGRDARSARADKAWRIVLVCVACVCAVYLVRTILRSPRDWMPHAAVGAILAGSSLALAWLARLAWTRMRSGAARALVVLALVYHALFGVAMLLQRIVSEVSRNDDLPNVLWPHVVHAINALE